LIASETVVDDCALPLCKAIQQSCSEYGYLQCR